MCCALVTGDVAYPGSKEAHPTVHAVSPSGVPLLIRKPRGAAASTSLQVGGPPVPRAPDRGQGIHGEGGRGRGYGGQSGASFGYGGTGRGRGGGATNGEIASKGGNFSILPPIKDSGKGKEGAGSFNLSELDDITLKNEVLRAMRDQSERSLQTLLSNMRAQDRDRDGVLSTDQVRATLNKFQVNLSDSSQRNLCKKFGQSGDHVPLVRYEDMFSYLTKSRMEALRAPPSKPSTGQSGGTLHPTQQQPRKVNLRNKALFSDRDEAKLIIDLERQLADKSVNMADLRNIMISLDRDRNDYITAQQVNIAFNKCGIQLTPDVMARLLLATDRTGAGMYKIETLIDYLIRIKPEAHNVMLGNNHHPRPPRIGRLPMHQNQPNLTAPWEYEASPQQMESKPDFLPDEGFSEEQYSFQQPPKQQYEDQPASLQAETEDSQEEAFDVQKWSEDYTHLANAVYNADADRSGYMAADDVRHITKTYSMVYNLGISDSSIASALSTATDPNYGEVNLEYFIAVLQDHHLRELQAY